MFKIFVAAVFTIVAIAFAGQHSSRDSITNCDGYGSHCAYDVEYQSESFVRNAIEQDAANRAADALANLTADSVKIQDKFANNSH